MDIDEALGRIQAGDRQAFAGIVMRFQGPLFAYLGRMGFGAAEAEELAQETFLRAWTHLQAFDARRGAFSTWLFAIARNFALNELARAANRPLAQQLPHEPACDVPLPADQLAVEQRRTRLRAALMQLPTADRSVLALAYMEDLAMADIARIEHCSTGAAKLRLHRARRRLAALLGEEDE